MEVRRLHYFLAVARELHFGRAATSLHISQPALSQQVKQLERELGAQLLERTTREVRLTPLGVQVAEQASFLEDAESLVVNSLDELVSGRRGALRIGFVPSAAFGLLPRLVAPFARDHPNVRLDLRETPSQKQLELVTHRRLDLGLVRDLNHVGEATQIPLVHEALVFACPEGHPATEYDRVPLASMANERFIVLPARVAPAMSRVITDLCKRAGIELDMALEALAFPTTLGLVASGMGVAIVPASVTSTKMPGLAYRKLEDAGAQSQISLVAPPGDKSALLQRFITAAQMRALSETEIS